MLKLFKSVWFRLLIVPSIIFVVMVLSYNTISKTIPVSFWDEVAWVGRSYFFEFYIHGDFKNIIWQSQPAYDQPKLAEYAYGAWLYPQYLNEKRNSETPFDYIQFLIKNGFYEIDERYTSAYLNYKNHSNFIELDFRDNGFSDELVAKYGPNILKLINLIYRARALSVVLLAGSVIFVYFFSVQNIGLIEATIFSLYYGFNSLIIETGLVAQSEALFVFTFNAAFLFMNLYFAKGRKFIHLLLFSLFSGLCTSTKLNGLMLVIIFIISNTFLFFVTKAKKVRFLFINIVPVLVSLIIFVSLNPFSLSNPIKNMQHMFDWRMNIANLQASSDKEESLPDVVSRVKRIFENFYFSTKVPLFNGGRFFKQLSVLDNYGDCLFILFSVGLFYCVRLAFKKYIYAIVTICSFISILTFMSYYLLLDWARYYIPLSLFFLMFQLLGLYIVAKYFGKYTRMLVKIIPNSQEKKKYVSHDT